MKGITFNPYLYFSYLCATGQSGGSDYSHHEVISPNHYGTSPHTETVEDHASGDVHPTSSASPTEETADKLEKVEEEKEEIVESEQDEQLNLSKYKGGQLILSFHTIKHFCFLP